MKSSQILKMIFCIGFLIFITGCATEKAVMQTPNPEPSAPVVKASTIEKVSFSEEENYTRIQIEGAQAIAPPFYKLSSDPLRIVIDVPNIDLKQIKSPLKIDNGTIGEMLATQYDDKGRIEISLVQMTNYNISKEEKKLVIDIEKVKKVVEAKEVKKEEEPKPETKREIPQAEPKKEEPPPTQPIVNKAKEVVDVLFEEKGDSVVFDILADGKIENFDAFKLDSPARLVLDIWGVDTRKNSFKVKNLYIKGVRIGHYQDKLRLVFDSQKAQLPPYQVNRIEDRVIVSLGNIPQPSEPQIYVQEKSTKESRSTPLKAQAEIRSNPGKPSTLTSIDFKQMDDKSRIVLSVSTEDPQFEASTPSKNTIAVEVKNAFAPKNLLKRLDTSAFGSAVSYMDLKNVKVGKGNDLQVLVSLAEEVPYETSKEGKEIFIDIKEKPKKIEARAEALAPEMKKGERVAEVKKEEAKKEEKPVPELKKEEVKAEEKPAPSIPAEKKVEEKAAPSTPVEKKVEEEKKIVEGGIIQASQKVYSGTKLSLDFKDADIKNILRLIAEVSNLNIITGDDVTGKITMRLVDVPWDQALEIILQSKNLGMTRVGNVVRIAPLDVLKKEIQAELEAKRAKERLEDLVMELIPINYAAAKEIMPQIKSILSERGDIKVDERTNTLIIKDIPKSIPPVKNLVKVLDRKTPLILIEARIIEANMLFQRELGVRWGFLAGNNPQVGGGNPGTTLGTPTTDVVSLPAVPRTGLGAAGEGAAGVLEFLFTHTGVLKRLDVAISAHEANGDVKIVSSPKIATLDNKEASIEQGLRIPYLKLTTEGTVTTDFIDANLKLTVTPHMTNDGNIKMVLKVKKDAPDWTHTVEGVPSIDKKEAISEVLVKDNGVVAIAGIYTIDKEGGNEGVPLFSKIPLLGWLFKRENKLDERRDLLIFISPKIIKDEV
jgi:type IV pilus assembly protein PilQ